MPDIIQLLTPRWSARPFEAPCAEGPLCIVTHNFAGGGLLDLVITIPTQRAGGIPYRHLFGVPVRVGAMEGEMYQDGGMKHWGLRKLGPGVWALDPSIHQPGVLHAYVVLQGVPDPAPFESTPAEPPKEES